MHDFQGHFSSTFRSWNFQGKNPGLFAGCVWTVEKWVIRVWTNEIPTLTTLTGTCPCEPVTRTSRWPWEAFKVDTWNTARSLTRRPVGCTPRPDTVHSLTSTDHTQRRTHHRHHMRQSPGSITQAIDGFRQWSVTVARGGDKSTASSLLHSLPFTPLQLLWPHTVTDRRVLTGYDMCSERTVVDMLSTEVDVHCVWSNDQWSVLDQPQRVRLLIDSWLHRVSTTGWSIYSHLNRTDTSLYTQTDTDHPQCSLAPAAWWSNRAMWVVHRPVINTYTLIDIDNDRPRHKVSINTEHSDNVHRRTLC